jgi:hypothetical protein
MAVASLLTPLTQCVGCVIAAIGFARMQAHVCLATFLHYFNGGFDFVLGTLKFHLIGLLFLRSISSEDPLK